MSRPARVRLSLVALVVVVASSALLLRTERASAGPVTSATAPCQSSALTSDYQIDRCLEGKIREITSRMQTALRRESGYLRYASPSQDWRVVQRTQRTFVAYAREECLAQTNPYRTGTIVPILYGECEVQLFDQRLAYIDHTIASLKSGGESQPTT